jgi:hypothetical protein
VGAEYGLDYEFKPSRPQPAVGAEYDFGLRLNLIVVLYINPRLS